jgi:hypothetical protein
VRTLPKPVSGMMPLGMKERAYFLIEMMGRYLCFLKRKPG